MLNHDNSLIFIYVAMVAERNSDHNFVKIDIYPTKKETHHKELYKYQVDHIS